jgi:hypothetical protein
MNDKVPVFTLSLLPVAMTNALGLNPGSAKGAEAKEVPPKKHNIILIKETVRYVVESLSPL